VIAGCGSNTSGPAGGSNVAATPTCDGIRAKIEQLYRADATAHAGKTNDPQRIDEAVADNSRMVANDCAKAPDKVAPCVVKATTVAEIEKTCLIQLDDEGTEAEQR